FAKIIELHAGGLVITSGSFFFAHIEQLAALAAQNKVPAIFGFRELYFDSINAAAPRFGIKLFSMDIDDKTNLERKLSDLAHEPNSGLIVLLDAFTYVNHDFIIDQVARYRIPAVYTVSFFPKAGGLASYGVDLADHFGQAA